MSLEITDDLIGRQPPEAQAIIYALLGRIAQLEQRVAELEARLKGEAGSKTPANSSLPPSSQHPHAKTAAGEEEIATQKRRPARTRQV